MSSLKRQLAERPHLGIFVKIPSTEIVEMIAWSGFDFIVIDTEHSPLSYNDVKMLTSVAQPQGLKVVVRPWNFADETLLHVLDTGVDGIQVPQLNGPGDAEKIVRAGRYPPLGTRGVAFSHRAGRYGFCDTKAYVKESNEETLIVAHIETRTAFDSMRGIARTAGIDILFLGPVDLSFSLGTDADYVNGGLKEAFLKMNAEAREAGKQMGTVVTDEKKLEFCLNHGIHYLIWDTDVGLFKKQLTAVRQTVKNYF
ncbi:MAG: aldolase [Firmicutes bacterium]|nr:aldolase [Bacillota bacterium]